MPEFDSTTEYRPIPNFPGYAAGSDGSIWTCRERGGPRQWRLGHVWRPMVPNVNNGSGYKRLTVTDANGKRYCRTVHVLVLEAFAGLCPSGLQARHLDGDQLNCRADNLAWGTVQANHDDKQRHGTTARGERGGRSKLTAEQVREIRLLAIQGVYLREIADRFGVTGPNVASIVRRRTWTHTDSDLPIPDIERHVRGSRHPNAKLTPDDVIEVRRLVASGETQQSVARRFAITQGAVSNIVNGIRRV